MEPDSRLVTGLLHQWKNGDQKALDELMPVVYDELRRLSARCLFHERPDHTLRATDLVHEAYLRLMGADVDWQDRIHFYSVAARIMRRKPIALTVPVPAAYAIGWFGETWARVTRQPGFVSREKITEATRARWVCDSRRASAELGVDSRTSLGAGLSRTLAWYKEAGWLKY